MTKRRAMVLIALVGFWGLGSVAAGDNLAPSSDAIVLVVAGQAGVWVSQIEAANPSSADFIIEANGRPLYSGDVCPGLCPFAQIGLPARGSGSFPDYKIWLASDRQLTTLYVIRPDEGPLPSVRARLINSMLPSQSVDVPAVRLSTLLAANPAALAFPGATQLGSARSTLVVTNLARIGQSQGSGIALRLEVFSERGQSLGSGTLSLDYGQTVILGNVVATLGVPSLEAGQIRVSKTSGDGVFWGVLYTIDANGAMSATVGRNP